MTKRGFAACLEISEKIELHEHIGWTRGGWFRRMNKMDAPGLYPYRLKFRLICEPARTLPLTYSTKAAGEDAAWNDTGALIDKLIFVTDKSPTWNVFIQPSIMAIPAQDFDTLHGLLSCR